MPSTIAPWRPPAKALDDQFLPFFLPALQQSAEGFPELRFYSRGHHRSWLWHCSRERGLSSSKTERLKCSGHSAPGQVRSSCAIHRKTSERSAINNEITWRLPLHNQQPSFLPRNLCFTPYAVSQKHVTSCVFGMIRRIFRKVIQPSCCWPSLFKILFLFCYKNNKCFCNLVLTGVSLSSKR